MKLDLLREGLLKRALQDVVLRRFVRKKVISDTFPGNEIYIIPAAIIVMK